MINIDKYAYTSKLKNQDPIYKLTFSMLTLGVCVWADSILVSVLVLMVMCWYTVYKGGIRFSLIIKLLIIPMSFLILGVLTVGFNVSKDQSIFLLSIPAFGTNVGVSRLGILNAMQLFFKALGAVSCLYYLSLSTPMVDLFAVLRKIKVPSLIIELMSLIYRFIFVLIETADTIYTSQNSRLGYSNLSSGYRSMAALASTLFIRAYKRSDELYTSLEARGYDGEINVVEEHFETHWTKYIPIVIIVLFLILVKFLTKQFTGGTF